MPPCNLFKGGGVPCVVCQCAPTHLEWQGQGGENGQAPPLVGECSPILIGWQVVIHAVDPQPTGGAAVALADLHKAGQAVHIAVDQQWDAAVHHHVNEVVHAVDGGLWQGVCKCRWLPETKKMPLVEIKPCML